MKNMTISMRMSPIYSLEHNTRKFLPNNVFSERIVDNLNFVIPNEADKNGNKYLNLKEIYDLCFEPYWKEQNEKRRNKLDCTYLEYLESKKLVSDKTKRRYPAVEIIVQIGNVDNAPIGSENSKIAQQILTDWYKDFASRDYVMTLTEKDLNNPNFKIPFEKSGFCILSAVQHNDEHGMELAPGEYSGGCSHIHLTVVPIGISEKYGMRYNSQLGNCMKNLGYSTEYGNVLDDDGNLMPIINEKGNIVTDKNGNTKYKQGPLKRGIVDFFEDEKNYIEDKFFREFDWKREKKVGRKKYLQIQDYKNFRSNERYKELEAKLQAGEFDAYECLAEILEKEKAITDRISDRLSHSVFKKISKDDVNVMLQYLAGLPQNERDNLISAIKNSKPIDNKIEETKFKIDEVIINATINSLKNEISNKNIKELYADYRLNSQNFWDNYYNEKLRLENKKNAKSNERYRLHHIENTLKYSNNLILNILGILLHLYLKNTETKYLEDIKNLVDTRKSLTATAKKFSSEAYNKRQDIELVKKEKELLSHLKKSQNVIDAEFDFENSKNWSLYK